MSLDAPARTGSTELVVVRLGGGRFGLDMDAIAEVGRPPSLTRVPGLPGWLAGVANWRGRVLPVLDVRPLLDVPVVELDRRSRLVVLHLRPPPEPAPAAPPSEVQLGLLVESVTGSVATAGPLEPTLASLAPAVAALLRGHLTDTGGPYGVLDLQALLALADTLPRARRA